jgi:hypothetical protein
VEHEEGRALLHHFFGPFPVVEHRTTLLTSDRPPEEDS